MPLSTHSKTRSAATHLIARVANVLVTLAGGHSALAQLKVRTETIKPPAATVSPSANQFVLPGRDGGPDALAIERPAAAGETARRRARPVRKSPPIFRDCRRRCCARAIAYWPRPTPAICRRSWP